MQVGHLILICTSENVTSYQMNVTEMHKFILKYRYLKVAQRSGIILYCP